MPRARFTRQPNVSASAAARAPAARFDNAACRHAHDSPSLKTQPVGNDSHGAPPRYGAWQAGKPFSWVRALMHTLLAALKPVYPVAGSVTTSGRLLLVVIPLVIGAGCASMPPVQEMSDARQAVQAAREADAGRYAPISFGEAERLLEEATRLLEKKNYRKARQSALEAKKMALKARHASAVKQHLEQ